MSSFFSQIKKQILCLFLLSSFLLLSSIAMAASYSFDTTSTSAAPDGGGTWGSIFVMTASLSGSTATFTIEKSDGSSFSSSGTMYLYEGAYDSSGTLYDTASVTGSSSTYSVDLTVDLSSYSSSSYPKEFYARYEPSSASGYATVGPITVTYTSSSTSVTYTEDTSSISTGPGGGGTWGNILTMEVSISGSDATFTVSKTSGGVFSTDGTMYLAVGSPTTAVTHDSKSVIGGSTTEIELEDDFSVYSSSTYPKEFYGYYEPSSTSGYAVVGPITISYSSTTISPPSTPSAPSVNATGSSTMSISWSSVSTATSYRLYRSTSSSSGFSLVYSGSSRSYSDSGLSSGTTYYYKIKAGNAGGYSDYSSTGSDTTTTSTSIPSTPSAPSVNATGSSTMSISWSSVSTATSYQLYRSTSSSSGFSLVDSGSSTSYSDSGLSASTTYYYYLTASNSAGTSSSSSVASDTTDAATTSGYSGPTLLIPLVGPDTWCINTEPGGWSTHEGDNYYAIDYDNNNTDCANTYTKDLDGVTPAIDVYVVAAASGTIDVHNRTGCSKGGTDCYVSIDHGGGYSTVYRHMKTDSIVVADGASVIQGQYLGVLGTTGYSDGPHVHFQVFYDGSSAETIPELSGVEVDGTRFDEIVFLDAYESSNTLYDPDGYTLGCDIRTNGYSITNTDSDSDGLADSFETGWGTDPNDADSDGDGVDDCLDYCQDTGSPIGSGDVLDDDGCLPSERDSDGDGWYDYYELGYDEETVLSFDFDSLSSSSSAMMAKSDDRYFGSGSSSADSSTVSDGTGNGNDGLVNGATSTTGLNGSALLFEGSEYVTVPDSDSLDMVHGLSVETWILPQDLTASNVEMIVKRGFSYANVTQTWQLYTWNRKIHFKAFTTSGSATISSSQRLADHQWVHITATYDGSELALYVNGQEVSSTPLSGDLITTTKDLYIGCEDSDCSSPFYGKIDDLNLYNTALSAEEIENNFLGSKQNLLLSLGFDSSSVDDESSYGQDVSNSGATFNTGYSGQGLELDGSSYLKVTDAPSLDLLEELTAQAWIYVDDVSSSTAQRILNRGFGISWGIHVYENKVYFYTNTSDDGGDYQICSYEIASATWTHVAGVYSKSDETMTLYVDGSSVCTLTQTGNLNVTWSDLYIGSKNSTPEQGLTGRMDEVKIYAKARSAEDISLDYQN